MKVYGIKNCNTVKKALTWLEENGIDYEFHDFKKLGVQKDTILEWEKEIDWPNLINRKGTTWRKLTEEEKLLANSKESARNLMQEKTSLIRRPVVVSNQGVILGFDEVEYNEKLK